MHSFSSLIETDEVSVNTDRASTQDGGEHRRALTFTHSQRVDCWSLSRSKRILDLLVALLVMALFCVPMLLIALCIRLTSRGPALFVQKRVGQNGRLFLIYKFRSMTMASHSSGAGLTMAGDSRVTPVGRWLRLLKLDELPQFYNVLRGEMSIVGPRPKLPEYAEELNFAYRPGLSGAASLAFRREEEILAQVHAHEMESFYHKRIKPLKAKIDERYMAQATFASDLQIIFSTVLASIMPNRYPALKYHDVQDAHKQELKQEPTKEPRREVVQADSPVVLRKTRHPEPA